MECYNHHSLCHEAPLSRMQILRSEQSEMLRRYKQQKTNQLVEILESKLRKVYRTGASIKNCRQKNFPYRRLLSEERLIEELSTGYSLDTLNVVSNMLNTCVTSFQFFFRCSKIVSEEEAQVLTEEFAIMKTLWLGAENRFSQAFN